MSRTTARLVGAGLLALLLTGCIKLHVDLDISSNNTVSGTMIFAFSKQLLAITGQSADQLLASTAPLPTNVPGLSSKPYQDSDYAGEEFTFDSVPLSKFNGTDPESLRIERQGDVFKVSGVLDLSKATSGVTGATGLGNAVNQALSTADIEITMTFPGKVTSSNGDVHGNSVTWKPKVGQRLELQATASAIGSGGSSTTILLIVIAAAAVVVIVIVAIALARRGRGGPPEEGGEGADAPMPSVMAPAAPAAPPPGDVTPAMPPAAPIPPPPAAPIPPPPSSGPGPSGTGEGETSQP
jgi:hypothetical protein